MTKAEKRYMNRVAELGCVLCEIIGCEGDTPANLHHVREGQGMSQRAQNWLAIPLCPACHQGQHGIHGDKALLRLAKVDEMDLLARTIERLNG